MSDISDALGISVSAISMALDDHPRIGAVTNSSKAPMKWTSGHIVDRDRHLYVSNGVGTSVVPFRMGCPPEVNFIHLGGAGGL